MKFTKLINFLNDINDETINIIDVGANNGDFPKELSGITKKTFWVGIEPNPFLNKMPHNITFNYAIDDIPTPKTQIFHIHHDSSCSSLLEMNQHLITHNINEKDNKWYVGRSGIESIKQDIEVTTVSLEYILNSIPKFTNELVHFVKIDTQGNDIRVAKSLNQFLNKTVLIMIETVTSKNENVVLYKGQTTSKKDIDTLDKLGFTIFDIFDYSDSASPEADIIFINKEFLK